MNVDKDKFSPSACPLFKIFGLLIMRLIVKGIYIYGRRKFLIEYIQMSRKL